MREVEQEKGKKKKMVISKNTTSKQCKKNTMVKVNVHILSIILLSFFLNYPDR